MLLIQKYTFYEVTMSTDFLEKLYSELLQKKSELELEQNNIAIKLKENENYIKRFQKEEEDNYDAFSPRNQNQELKKKIDSFQKENQLLLQKNEEIEIKLNEINEKIQGFDLVLKEERNIKTSVKKNEKQKKKYRKLQENYKKDISSIIYKLEFCSQLIDIDPARCKLELSSLIKILYEKIEDEKQKVSETGEEV